MAARPGSILVVDDELEFCRFVEDCLGKVGHEGELFGHVRGAFTDARSDKTGLLQKAHGGTIFFDEIGEMAPARQVRLVRVLGERSVRRVGAIENEAIDIRVVAATKRDLETGIASGLFRSDLYYCLNVVELAHAPTTEDDVWRVETRPHARAGDASPHSARPRAYGWQSIGRGGAARHRSEDTVEEDQ